MSPMQSKITSGIGPNPNNAANGANGTTTAMTTTDSVASNKEFPGATTEERLPASNHKHYHLGDRGVPEGLMGSARPIEVGRRHVLGARDLGESSLMSVSMVEPGSAPRFAARTSEAVRGLPLRSFSVTPP